MENYTKFLLHFFLHYARISTMNRQVSATEKQTKDLAGMVPLKRTSSKRWKMKEPTKYYLVRKKAVPEVLLKVVEAKELLETERVTSIQEAADAVGISRSSFYKYKDDILEFHDHSQGTTITLTFQMDDEPGLLSDVLKIIADFRGNILTIHQSIPINGVASLSISIQILENTGDVSAMIEEMENQKGMHHVKILAKE